MVAVGRGITQDTLERSGNRCGEKEGGRDDTLHW